MYYKISHKFLYEGSFFLLGKLSVSLFYSILLGRKRSRHCLKIEKCKIILFYIQFAFSSTLDAQSVSTILFVADLSEQEGDVDMK